MKWFRKIFIWLVASFMAATAAGQETTWRPGIPAAAPVSLGRPTPLGNGGTLTPIYQDPQSSGLQQASFVPTSRPSVVRAAQPLMEEEPKYLPDMTAPAGESRIFLSILPALERQPARNLQAVQAVQDAPKIIEIDKSGKVTVIPDPPRLSAPGTPTGPITIIEEGAVVVDQFGDSFINAGFGGAHGFYARGEWLLWWTRGMHLPPLVTTASPFDPEITRGALGFGTTTIVYGNSTTSAGPNSGARFTVGYDLDPCGLCALEGTFFFLGKKNDNHLFDSNNYPVLGRPFFNINQGTQDRELTTSPALLPGDVLNSIGNIRITTSSSLWGAEANLRSNLWCGCDYKITGLVGFRYLNLSDQLGITEQALVLQGIPGTAINAGDQITVFDRFNTRNQFFGGQLGLGGEWQRGRWTLEGTAKFALGATYQSVDVNGGQQIVSANGRTQNFNGGLYALPSNIGSHSQTRFGFVPEIGVKLGYDITENIRVFVGYDFLYWSSVLRAGDQIDQALDVNQVPNAGAAFPPANQVRPVVPFRPTSYWATGVNAGILFRF